MSFSTSSIYTIKGGSKIVPLYLFINNDPPEEDQILIFKEQSLEFLFPLLIFKEQSRSDMLNEYDLLFFEEQYTESATSFFPLLTFKQQDTNSL